MVQAQVAFRICRPLDMAAYVSWLTAQTKWKGAGAKFLIAYLETG